MNATAAVSSAVGPVVHRGRAALVPPVLLELEGEAPEPPGVAPAPPALAGFCDALGLGTAFTDALSSAITADTPFFALSTSTSVTGLKLFAAFWYVTLFPTSDTRLSTFHLFAGSIIKGYAAMKVATESVESSCSRMMRPGLLGPVSQPCIWLWILAAVVYGGETVRVQSAVSWFQTMVVRPNTSLAMAETGIGVAIGRAPKSGNASTS